MTTGSTVPEHGCLWHLPFKSGIANDYISTRWFLREYAALRGQQAKGVREIADLARENHELRALFVRFGRNLASILAP